MQSKSLRSSLKLPEARQGGVSSLATSLPRRQPFGWELLPSQASTLISAPPSSPSHRFSPVRSLESSTPGCGVPGATSCRNHSPSAASLASPSLERRLCCMKTSPSRAVLTRSSPGKQEATSRGGRARLGLLGDTGDVPQPPPAGKPKECFPGKHASGFYLAS